MIVNTSNSATSLGSLSGLGGNRGVLAAADNLLRNNERFALVIVVGAQGSTYRKPGALALIAENGATQSVISGGCLEPTLRDIAMTTIRDQEPASLLLDTSTEDDLIFGSGSGCRGKMRVVIIPITPSNPHPIYQAITHGLHHHQAVKFALVVSQPRCAQGCAWSAEQVWRFGDCANEVQELRRAADGERVVRLAATDEVTVAIFSVAPPPRLLMVGAGVEVPFLIPMTRSLGWHNTVIDHREQQLASLMDADTCIHSRPAATSQLNDTHFDAALIMSHSASIDLEALRWLGTRGERYVGLLGPPVRRDELLSQLTEAERSRVLPRLHAPLGLKLGGDGPEPLALSIIAELQRFFHEPIS